MKKFLITAELLVQVEIVAENLDEVSAKFEELGLTQDTDTTRVVDARISEINEIDENGDLVEDDEIIIIDENEEEDEDEDIDEDEDEDNGLRSKLYDLYDRVQGLEQKIEMMIDEIDD